jgi:hypothetical protein
MRGCCKSIAHDPKRPYVALDWRTANELLRPDTNCFYDRAPFFDFGCPEGAQRFRRLPIARKYLLCAAVVIGRRSSAVMPSNRARRRRKAMRWADIAGG